LSRVFNILLHPSCLITGLVVSSLDKEHEAMTQVIPMHGRRAGTLIAPRAVPPSVRPPEASTIDRQAAIENALTMALHFMRQPGNAAANLWAATARTNRALTLLKSAAQGLPSDQVGR
jgi:hypothetical protein